MSSAENTPAKTAKPMKKLRQATRLVHGGTMRSQFGETSEASIEYETSSARTIEAWAGTSMAAFGKQLSDTDIAAAITYERNSWSNKTGDVVQPSDVKAARK